VGALGSTSHSREKLRERWVGKRKGGLRQQRGVPNFRVSLSFVDVEFGVGNAYKQEGTGGAMDCSVEQGEERGKGGRGVEKRRRFESKKGKRRGGGKSV